MRVGVIGCGLQGTVHVDAYERIDGADVVAVCDADPGCRDAAARSGAAPFTSHRDLLAESAVDLVSVCTMPASHQEIVCDAPTAGAHVLCEKPLARSLEEARV